MKFKITQTIKMYAMCLQIIKKKRKKKRVNLKSWLKDLRRVSLDELNVKDDPGQGCKLSCKHRKCEIHSNSEYPIRIQTRTPKTALSMN